MRGLALALALLAAPAAAGPAEELARAVAGLEAAEGAQDRIAALTATLAAYDAGLAGLRDALRQGALREAAIARRLAAESAQVARLLGVLTALERTEGPLLLLHPAGPLGTARSGMILAEVTPGLQAEVAALQADLAELAAIRVLQQQAAATLEAGARQVQAARAALGQALAQRADLPPRLTEDAAAVARLAEGVTTLEALAAGMLALPGVTDAPAESFAEARGRLPWPVQGRLIRRAGEADAAGIRRPGLVLAARPAALVTAPWPATLRYAGPLADYANVMVLEPEEGYLLILAGVETVFPRPGTVLEPGAALALMGGREPDAAEFLSAARLGALEASETLYVELREDGVAVDPAEWFTDPQD